MRKARLRTHQETEHKSISIGVVKRAQFELGTRYDDRNQNHDEAPESKLKICLPRQIRTGEGNLVEMDQADFNKHESKQRKHRQMSEGLQCRTHAISERCTKKPHRSHGQNKQRAPRHSTT